MSQHIHSRTPRPAPPVGLMRLSVLQRLLGAAAVAAVLWVAIIGVLGS